MPLKTLQDFQAAEEKRAELYEEYENVEVVPLGIEKIAITYW